MNDVITEFPILLDALLAMRGALFVLFLEFVGLIVFIITKSDYLFESFYVGVCFFVHS